VLRAPLLAVLLLLATAGEAAAQRDPRVDPPRDTVQPGMLIRNADSQCTANFMFDGVGKLRGRHYLGTAAHCVDDRIGTPVLDHAGRRIGTVAFSGWPYSSYADDWAFIQLDKAVYVRASPALAGHPGLPTGVLPSAAGAAGDRVQLSGWGFVTADTERGREQRVSVLYANRPRLWFAEAVVSNSDSGGPAVHLPTGGAVGSVSNFGVPLPVDHGAGWEPGATVYGPTIAGTLAEAARRGITLELRTADEGPPSAKAR
jgi:hypothetical protein